MQWEVDHDHLVLVIMQVNETIHATTASAIKPITILNSKNQNGILNLINFNLTLLYLANTVCQKIYEQFYSFLDETIIKYIYRITTQN